MASRSFGRSAISFSSIFLASSVRSSASRLVASWMSALRLQRRVGRHALIDLDGQRRLLDRLIEVGERHQRERMVSARDRSRAADRRARDPRRPGGRATCRGRTGLRQRRPAAIRPAAELLAVLDLAHRLDDQRMLRQHLVERLVNLQRLVLADIARGPAAVRLDGAQRVGVELVDLLQPLAGFLAVARDDRGSARRAGP